MFLGAVLRGVIDYQKSTTALKTVPIHHTGARVNPSPPTTSQPQMGGKMPVVQQLPFFNQLFIYKIKSSLTSFSHVFPPDQFQGYHY